MPKIKEKINTTSIFDRLKRINTRGLMFIAIVLMAFVIGRLTQKVEDLQGGLTTTNTTAATTQTGTGTQPVANPTINLATVKDLWNKDVIKLGDANKKLLFVEIGDPSCPYCHVAGGENKTIGASMGPNFKLISEGGTYVAPVTEMKKLVQNSQASFAYIYFPGHGAGEMAMKALYCATEKGKFWQAHDLLMTADGYNLINNTVKNDKTQSGTMATYLKSAVDSTFLKSCLDSGKYDARLGADQAIASSLFTEAKAQQGTPGFIVNSSVYPGAYNWTDMKTVADAALK